MVLRGSGVVWHRSHMQQLLNELLCRVVGAYGDWLAAQGMLYTGGQSSEDLGNEFLSEVGMTQPGMLDLALPFNVIDHTATADGDTIRPNAGIEPRRY
jgi:hypothetical protein